jgi:hypothetical protein
VPLPSEIVNTHIQSCKPRVSEGGGGAIKVGQGFNINLTTCNIFRKLTKISHRSRFSSVCRGYKQEMNELGKSRELGVSVGTITSRYMKILTVVTWKSH